MRGKGHQGRLLTEVPLPSSEHLEHRDDERPDRRLRAAGRRIGYPCEADYYIADLGVKSLELACIGLRGQGLTIAK